VPSQRARRATFFPSLSLNMSLSLSLVVTRYRSRYRFRWSRYRVRYQSRYRVTLQPSSLSRYRLDLMAAGVPDLSFVSVMNCRPCQLWAT
jgi:hypothetical protein